MHTTPICITGQERLRIDENRSNQNVIFIESITCDPRIVDRKLNGSCRTGTPDGFGCYYGRVVCRLYVGKEWTVERRTI
jgi:hypothetical protein